MGTFGDSWQLTKTAFRTIREDKALLVFPLVSGLAAIGIIVLFAVGFFGVVFWSHLTGSTFQIVVGAMALALYFILWIVSIYFHGALVGAAMMKLNGGQPRFADGMAAARGRAGKLVAWALIAGTVMLIIRALTSRSRGLVGAIIGMAASLSWGVLTYFVLPVIMFEQLGAWSSLKRSGSLYFHHFGRTFLSNIVLGLLLGAGFVLGIVLIVAGVYFAIQLSVVLGLVMVLAGVAVVIFMAILSSAAEGVLTTALYRYATTGQVVPGLVNPRYLGMVSASPTSASMGSSSAPLPSSSTWSHPPPPPPLPPMSRS